jgi:outer membrane protein
MSFKRPGRASAAPGLRPLLIAAALACGAAGASAQSLSAIYEAARGYDPTYLGAKATAEAAQYSLEEVKALNRPGVTATLQAGDQRVNTPHSVPTSEDNKSVSGTVAAQLSLFNRQNDVLIDQARRGYEASKAALVIADEDLIVRVAAAYFDVLSSAEALQTVLANKRAIGEQLASAKRNFDVGNATITDTREAQARFDLTIAQEVVARNDLQVKKVTLDQIVGRAGVIPQALPPTVTLPPVLPSQAEDWVRLAQTESPSLKQARLAFEVAQLETDKAKAGHLPTLAVQASYNRTRVNSDISQISNGGTGTTGQLALVLNVPLFSGFAVQNRVKETVLLQEKARNDVDAATNGTALGTRTAFLGAQAQAAQVKALEAAESSSRLALESTQLGYKVGVRVNLDVLNAQSQLSNTERDLAKARYDYLLATLKLRQAAGTLTANDLLPINAMLTVPLATDTPPAAPAQPVTSTAPKP